MRIIGGTYKGKHIIAGNKLNLRPTTDFAKEGLFNILSNRFDFEQSVVLDLFAGTGSISYEFASRGCSEIHSVEMNHKHIEFIRSTLKQLNATQVRVIRDDAYHFLSICKIQYDIIFSDPPYDDSRLPEIPDIIFSRSLLKPEGIFILEHSKTNDFSDHPFFEMHRHYGNVHFTFFKNK